jgi:hypothetical protein
MRTHGDHFVAPIAVRPETPATPERSQAELCAYAAERASALRIGPDARVMIDLDAHPDPVDWLLAPMSAGASIVLCRHPDPDKLDARAGAELVTHRI